MIRSDYIISCGAILVFFNLFKYLNVRSVSWNCIDEVTFGFVIPYCFSSTHGGGQEYNRAQQLTDLVALREAIQTIPLWGQIVIKKLLNCSKCLQGYAKQSGRSVNWCLLVTVGIFPNSTQQKIG